MTVLNVGQLYIVTFTHPMYVKSEQRYLPDNFRFVEPDTLRGIYGGRVRNGPPCKCEICGRSSKDYYEFWDVENGKEVYISPKCMEHESSRVWGQSTDPKRIQEWYERKSLEDGARRGNLRLQIIDVLSDGEGRTARQVAGEIFGASANKYKVRNVRKMLNSLATDGVVTRKEARAVVRAWKYRLSEGFA